MKVAGIILSILMIIGCSAITNAIYGPDMTPDQLKNAVYEDAYSIANIRMGVALGRMESEKEKLEFIDEVLDRIAMVKISTDPMAAINQYWYQEITKRDPGELAIISLACFLAKKVLNRIGIQAIDDGFEAIDFDRELFAHAIGAYEKCVLDVKAQI